MVNEKRRPTIIDVAREAGVSAATVSNALNNTRYVNVETKRRIDDARRALGYTRNVHARRLRSSGIETIGLFSSMPFAIQSEGSGLGFLMEVVAAASVIALESGFALSLFPPLGLDPSRFNDLAIAAALVLEPDANDPYVAHLRATATPFVTIGLQPGAPPGGAAVDLDSRRTATLLLDHLLAAGARRIALMIGANRRTSHLEAEAAYQEYAASAAHAPIVFRLEETGGEAAAYAAAAALIDAHPEVDGLLAPVDRFAAGALRAFIDRGIPVPDQIRIATRHDGPRSRELRPQITAVNLHLEAVAKIAVDLLIKQVRDGQHPETVIAPPSELIVRNSTVAG